MACRIDLFAAESGTIGAPAGFASASDEDEERLAALLADIAGRTALEASTHSNGRVERAEGGPARRAGQRGGRDVRGPGSRCHGGRRARFN